MINRDRNLFLQCQMCIRDRDIPLAGVLKSPIGGMKDRELAIVMAEFKKDPDRGEEIGFYGAVKRYLERHGDLEEEALRQGGSGENVQEKSEEETVIYRRLDAFRNLPVSYTHLDVYKRQVAISM